MEKYIKTIGELEKNIGKVVVCYYYKSSITITKEIAFMWMFKLTKYYNNGIYIPYSNLYDKFDEIGHKEIYGINKICLVDAKEKITPYLMYNSKNNKTIYNKLSRFDLRIPTASSAQDYIRLANKDELNIYLQLTRKRGI